MTHDGRRRSPARSLLCALCLLAAGFPASGASVASDDLAAIEALVDSGFHRQALKLIEDLLATDPGEPQVLFLKGLALAETGSGEEAIAIFTRLAADHPDLPEPHNNLAVLHAMRGEHEQARQALMAAIEANPENPRYHENLGDLYLDLAIAAYGKAADLGEPGDSAEAKLEQTQGILEGRKIPETGVAGAVAGDGPVPAAAPCAGAVAALHGWAEAWSGKDVQAYLASYSDAFQPPWGLSRERWQAQRRERLSQPRFIEVTVAETEVELCAEQRARLTFTQTYRSDTFRDRVRKEIWMSRAGEGWKIVSERSLDGDRR